MSCAKCKFWIKRKPFSFWKNQYINGILWKSLVFQAKMEKTSCADFGVNWENCDFMYLSEKNLIFETFGFRRGGRLRLPHHRPSWIIRIIITSTSTPRNLFLCNNHPDCLRLHRRWIRNQWESFKIFIKFNYK